jgi:ubiquinone/menaquinone biosynthesis C-methylase UbiE
MGIRYQWHDNIMLDVFIEQPWTWTEYRAMMDPMFEALQSKQTPCATVVHIEKMGGVPKDGNVIQILMEVDRRMPKNVFASAIVGRSNIITTFMNVLMRIRPNARRITLFCKDAQEAYEQIHERYKKLADTEKTGQAKIMAEQPTSKPEQPNSVADNYDAVADKYDMSFQLAPLRLHIEAYSVRNILGDVTGKSVLDLATGTGFYARMVKKRGASRVVGVDIADQMVQVGRMAEQAEPLGIEYHTQDITQFQTDEPFDIALAVYLLHYAPSKEALAMMCHAIANMLKPGGRFITYIANPDMARQPDYYKRHGINNVMSDTPSDGEMFTFTATIGEVTTPPFTAYRWDKNTVNEALTQAGFTNIRWVMPTLSPDGEKQHGADYFADYLQQPHAVLIECIKQ